MSSQQNTTPNDEATARRARLIAMEREVENERRRIEEEERREHEARARESARRLREIQAQQYAQEEQRRQQAAAMLAQTRAPRQRGTTRRVATSVELSARRSASPVASGSRDSGAPQQ